MLRGMLAHLPKAPVALIALMLFLPARAPPAEAQEATGAEVNGLVADRRSGRPVRDAVVRIRAAGSAAGEPGWTGTSDESGRFRSAILPFGEYELRIEVPPYTPLDGSFTLTQPGVFDLRAEMVGAEYELDPVIVVAGRQSRLQNVGFYERRDVGLGDYLTRGELVVLNPSRISDVFREIPGARVIPGRGGLNDQVRLRGNCVPIIVLDGIRLANPVVLDNILAVNDIEAVEVYQGATTPIEYISITTCGVVMIWTRDPSVQGRGFSWGRVVFIVAFGVVMLFGPR